MMPPGTYLQPHQRDKDATWSRDKALDKYIRGALAAVQVPLTGQHFSQAVYGVAYVVDTEKPATFELACSVADKVIGLWLQQVGDVLLDPRMQAQGPASEGFATINGGVGRRTKVQPTEFNDALKLLRMAKERSGL